MELRGSSSAYQMVRGESQSSEPPLYIIHKITLKTLSRQVCLGPLVEASVKENAAAMVKIRKVKKKSLVWSSRERLSCLRRRRHIAGKSILCFSTKSFLVVSSVTF